MRTSNDIEFVEGSKTIRDDALFYALANGISNNKPFHGMLFPINTFPSGVEKTPDGSIIMRSTLTYKDGLVQKTKVFVPFTENGDLIEDYVNGFVELYPRYHLMVLEYDSMDVANKTGNVTNVVAIYHLNSSRYETVYVNEKGRILSTKEKYNISDDEIIVTRFQPMSFNAIEGETNHVFPLSTMPE